MNYMAATKQNTADDKNEPKWLKRINRIPEIELELWESRQTIYWLIVIYIE